MTGQVLANRDPTTYDWSIQSQDVTFASTPRAGLAGNDTKGRLLVVLAPPSGMYVRSDYEWTHLAGPPFDTGPANPSFPLCKPVQPGRRSPIIIVYDPAVGLYKSSDYAQHFFLLMTAPSARAVNGLEMDQRGHCYLEAAGVLYRIDHADDPTAWNAAPPTVDNAGLTAVTLRTDAFSIGLTQ